MKTWPALPPLPSPNVPVIERGGLANRDWYAWFQRADIVLREVQLLGINDLADVDLSTPPNDGEFLKWVAGDSAWKPSTVELSLGDLTDVDLTTPPTDGQQLTFIDADSTWQPDTA